MTDLSNPEGLRTRKKRETQHRIAEAAIELFLAKGYEATTLDEIAAAAGIARRTFFYYFKSKEAILQAFVDGGFAPSFRPILIAQPPGSSPLEAVRNSLIQLFSARDPEKSLAVYNLLATTEVLRSRMLAVPAEMENCVFETLCELWPEPGMRDTLRLVAVVSIGAMRVAKEAWRRDEGRYPLATYLQESFAALEKAV